MAALAPAGPPAPVAAVLAAQATTEGRSWKSTLTAPIPPAVPPALLNNVFYAPPAPALGAATPAAFNPRCDDRQFHDTPGTNGNDCSSLWNPVAPGTANAPQPFHRRACANNGVLHGWDFMLCRYCRDNTEDQAWYNSIVNDVTTHPAPIPRPPVPTVGAGAMPDNPVQDVLHLVTGAVQTQAYRNFLTRLCYECEIAEQILLHRRRRDLVRDSAVVPTGWPLLRQPPNTSFPESTCKCLGMLEGPLGLPYCIRCRYFQGRAYHERALILRQQNDSWLRRTTKNRFTGKLQQAHGNTVINRKKRGEYRACRCGADIPYKANRPPEVLQCLGCEGILHVGAYALPGTAPTAIANNSMPATSSRLAQNIQAGTADLRLRRPY